jgi:hypothetical protein
MLPLIVTQIRRETGSAVPLFFSSRTNEQGKLKSRSRSSTSSLKPRIISSLGTDVRVESWAIGLFRLKYAIKNGIIFP